jgi:hypothetical protein
MSEDIAEVVEEQSDKELNFAKLRSRAEAAEARLAELEPLAIAHAVRSAGFDPDTPEGKALSRLATAGADADAVKTLAEELGFEAGSKRPQLNEFQQEQWDAAQRQQNLHSFTSPDAPPTVEAQIAELDAQIVQARNDGNPTAHLLSQRVSLATRLAMEAGPRQ